jgi:hypothetical protein
MTANKSFKIMVKFNYLRMTVTKQNCIHEQIKSRLNSENATIEFKIVFDCLLHKNPNIKI